MLMLLAHQFTGEAGRVGDNPEEVVIDVVMMRDISVGKPLNTEEKFS